MSSRASYGAGSYAQDKGYTPRSSSPRSSASSASSVYAHSAHSAHSQSSRAHRYGSKPPVIHNGGGQSNDPNTSTSAPNSGYYN